MIRDFKDVVPQRHVYKNRFDDDASVALNQRLQIDRDDTLARCKLSPVCVPVPYVTLASLRYL